ncbi:MAG: gliding motility-associated C-terminal domain-containing protein [Cytophagales bacterium]
MSSFKNSFLFTLCIFITQLFGQIDQKFWFAAPDISHQHADLPIYLKFSPMDADANVVVSIPSLKLQIANIKVKLNSLYVLDLTNYSDLLESGNYGNVMSNALLIESDQEIMAYYEVSGTSTYGPSNCDIYSLKGSNALGTEFYLPFQNFWQQETQLTDAWASFQVVATEDNTVVEILPTQDLSVHKKGVLFSVKLNKGQVYTDRAKSNDPRLRPTGTVVRSNKKVAITITDDSMYDNQLNYTGAWDMAGDQIVPTDKLGTKYIVNKINTSYIGIDRVFITSTTNNNKIVINSKDTLSLNSGDTKSYVLSEDFNLIQSTLPIYVFHIGGFDSELGGALLPSIGCTGSKRVVIGSSYVDSKAYVSLVVQKGAENSFVCNGFKNVINSTDFQVLAFDTNYVCAKISMDLLTTNLQSLVLENPKSSFQAGLLNGVGNTTFMYGYFSDFGTLNLPDTLTICSNNISNSKAFLNAGFGKDVYKWYFNGDLLSDTAYKINIYKEGNYKVYVKKGDCVFEDSTKIQVFQTDSRLFDKDSIFVCSNNTDTLFLTKKYKSYMWNTGSADSVVVGLKLPKYNVTVTDSNNCSSSDTVAVKNYKLNELQFDIPNESSFCTSTDSCVSLNILNTYLKYFINEKEIIQSFNTSELCLKTDYEKFKIKVIDTNKCEQSKEFSFDCSKYIGQIPNIITPQLKDGLNDFFVIPNLKNGTWSLQIYNRYGVNVYENNFYDNSWQAKDIEDGVYFYQLKHKNSNIEKKGWVEVR